MAKNKKKKQTENIEELIDNLSRDIVGEDTSNQVEHGIPDIMTFVYDEKYLGLGTGSSPVKLTMAQTIALKVFFRGSMGNENVELTDEEKQYCKDIGLIDDDPEKGKGDVLGKYESGHLFRELVLVWGRRSGKDYIASIIALYEALRLLELPGGDPYAYYGIGRGNEITILTVAASQKQATVAFREIREKLRHSKYFQDRYLNDGLQTNSVTLLTPRDKEDNEGFRKKGLSPSLGSVKIQVGHSNPDTLVGFSCYVLILDEVASYKVGTAGAGSGDKIYSQLQPTTTGYMREEPIYDEDGNPVYDETTGEQKIRRRYDGKIISISSPRGKEGKLWELWSTAYKANKRLACRMATWDVQPKRYPEETLREEYPSMSEEEFMMEFGAEFSGTAGENMFPPEFIDAAFKNHKYKLKDIGEPGHVYFAHLDPARNSHNYALVVCHKEHFLDPETKKTDYRVVVDHIKVWKPTPDNIIEVERVDEYVISLKRRFNLGLVTYDTWNSLSSVQKLQKYGIPAQMKQFNPKFKMQIYKELEEILNSGRLIIPWHELLYNELLYLQRKFYETGFKVFPKQDGEVPKTDDVADALAGAVYHSLEQQVNRLPSARLVNTGSSPSSNQIPWRNMQGGTYGIGSGQQVSSQLESRNSWPHYRR